MKKFEKEFRAMVVQNLELRGIVLDERGEAEFVTPFGDVSVHLHDDWVHFNLLDYGAKYPEKWYGFDHWKQNYYTFASSSENKLEAKDFEPDFNYHVNKFFRERQDKG